VLWGHGAGLDHVYLYNDPQDELPHFLEPEINDEKEQVEIEGGTLSTEKAWSGWHPAGADAFDILNSDDAHANRYLSDIRLGGILAGFANRLGHKIDLLGFDACLMGLAEIFHELSPAVALAVGSDEELPKGSWPYDSIFGDLTRFPGMDACTLSAVFPSQYTWPGMATMAGTRPERTLGT